MQPPDISDLNAFIVRAKAATYVGDGSIQMPAGQDRMIFVLQTENGLTMIVILVAATLSVRKLSILRTVRYGP